MVWNGPLNEDVERGDMPWNIIAPSACSVGEGWQIPEEMSEEQICELIDDFIAAAGEPRAQAIKQSSYMALMVI